MKNLLNGIYQKNKMFITYFVFILLYFSLNILLYKYSYNLKLVDKPNLRKIHSSPTPFIGGIAILLPFYIFTFYYEKDSLYLTIVFLSLPIFLISILDDIFELDFKFRLFAQIFCTFIVILNGINIENLNYDNDININLGLFNYVFTFFCIIVFMNSINFIDGIDGLASGSIILSIINIIFFSFYFENFSINTSIYLLLILLILFFFQNLNIFNKKIFLGDSGSQTLGFLLGCYLIYTTMDINNFFPPTLAIWCTAIPIYDFTYLFFYRLINKKNPMKPDNSHIHHVLGNNLSSNSKALIILLIFSILITILGFITYLFFGPIVNIILFVLIFILFVYFKNNFKIKIN